MVMLVAGFEGRNKDDRPHVTVQNSSSNRPQLVLGGLVVGAIGLFGIQLAVSGVSPLLDNPLTYSLPFYALRSLSRMTLAYLLSLSFALAYGITAALNHRASHVMLPLLDILQSVPVLAFLPLVFIFFLNRFPGVIGEELSSIILIFTAMAWAPTFGVIAGINSIPQDIKEAARAYGVGGFRYLRHIALPAVYPELVWTSMLAWGGGWFFIPVEEYFTFGNQTHTLPGLGFYIAEAASSNDLASSVFGLTVLVTIIVAIDRLVWRPLSNRAEKYKYETVSLGRGYVHHEGRVLGGFRRAEDRLVSPILSFLRYEKTYLTSFLETVHLRPRFHLSDRIRLHERLAHHALWGKILSVAIFLILIILGIAVLSNVEPSSIAQALSDLETYPGLLTLAYLTGRSMLRILTAYLIALGWTLVAGILIARSERFSKILVPLFDIGQSIPATALFPIIVLLLVNPFPGNSWALETASIIVLLAGMQWYILFNIVGAVHSLPTDILEVSSAYRVKGRRFVKDILVPASYPAIIIGSIQAWGGGWNTTIVSESIGSTTELRGLGSLLVNATTLSNTNLGTVAIAASILIMTTTVVLINRLVWRRLLKKADKYKFEA